MHSIPVTVGIISVQCPCVTVFLDTQLMSFMSLIFHVFSHRKFVLCCSHHLVSRCESPPLCYFVYQTNVQFLVMSVLCITGAMFLCLWYLH